MSLMKTSEEGWSLVSCVKEEHEERRMEGEGGDEHITNNVKEAKKKRWEPWTWSWDRKRVGRVLGSVEKR